MKITDRVKDVIKTGGEWISSLDLEDLILKHPGVAEAAVIGVADAKGAQDCHACHQAKKDSGFVFSALRD